MNNLFAHGKLRKGGSDNRLITGAGMLGQAVTEQDFALFLANKKPVITKRPVSKIKGEVYSITDDMLALIDRIEGHPRVNKREIVRVTLENGNVIEAWLYFNVQPLQNSVLLESGEYLGPEKTL
jgi:gamma-glutamylcyclotransferase (GGCT)/AIG2-like uncharacterized protein YtfP